MDKKKSAEYEGYRLNFILEGIITVMRAFGRHYCSGWNILDLLFMLNLGAFLTYRGIIDADNTDAGGQPSAPPSANAQQAQHGLAKCMKNVCVLLREEHNALLVAPLLLTRSPLERHALARVPLERGPPAQTLASNACPSNASRTTARGLPHEC